LTFLGVRDHDLGEVLHLSAPVQGSYGNSGLYRHQQFDTPDRFGFDVAKPMPVGSKRPRKPDLTKNYALIRKVFAAVAATHR